MSKPGKKNMSLLTVAQPGLYVIFIFFLMPVHRFYVLFYSQKKKVKFEVELILFPQATKERKWISI